jgi:ChrR-like protein with cupin domain
MAKPELEFHQPDGAWIRSEGPVAGIWEQVLAADPETGSYTGLTRYDPGVNTSPIGRRVHDYWEEVYLLQGDLTDLHLGRRFVAGMYACRPPGMAHGPWRTEQGVTMLEIRYRVP